MSPTTNEKLKLGIIGCGWAAVNLHLPTLRRMPEYDVVAVADMNFGQAQTIGNRFEVRHRFREASELLEYPALDAVAICTPPGDHASLAIAAINAGKHVVIEKPLTLTLAQADRLVESATRTEIKVLVGFNLRWHRLVREAKALLDANGLGPLTLMRTVFTNSLVHDDRIVAWRRDRSCGGGVIQDLAVHHFDLWRFLLRSEVQEISVSARSNRWQDEAAVISARMANGILVSSVFASGTGERHELECYGEAGQLRVSCYRYDGLQRSSMGTSSLTGRLANAAAKVMALPGAFVRMRSGGEISASYHAQWRHFHDCIRIGSPVGCTVEDGRRAVALATAATESSLTGHPIILKP
ncbi:MAG: Gfo/Idh/MocA family oxidoreductase [Nitrospiraceae bacterium]